MKKFEQLKRQFASLNGYLDVADLSDKNISATTADFDRLFELAWKTLKAYMYGELGMYEAKTGSPREILKLAAAQELLSEDAIWLSMLKDRNDDSHIYQRSDAILYMSKIADRYLPAVGRLIERLEGLIPQERLEEGQIPEDMLAYSIKNNIPLYRLVEKIRDIYGCQTNMQAYRRWEDYEKDFHLS